MPLKQLDNEPLKETLKNPKTTWKPPITLNSKQPPSQTLIKDPKKILKPKLKKKTLKNPQ
jgi:hypothetical protein